MPEPAPTPAPPDAVTQRFLDACTRLEGFSPDFAAEWADGFLTGVLAGPRAVPPEEWLPLLLPDGLFERTFADPDDAAWGRQALLEHARALARRLDPERLLDDPDTLHLAPLVVTWDAEARAKAVVHGLLDAAEADDQLLTGRTWAEGVLAAFQALPQDWPAPDDAPDDDYLALLATVSALVLPQAQLDELQDQVPEGGEPPTREQMIDEVCFALQDLRLYWVDHAPRPATRRVEVVPGRNDPCPCGSGRKYKKCHGA